MKNVIAVAISIAVVIAIFVVMDLLFGKPSIVPETLDVAANLEAIDASVPDEFSNSAEFERMNAFLGNTRALALEAVEVFNEGRGKAHRFNGRESVNATIRDGEVNVSYDFSFDGVLRSVTFRDAKNRALVCSFRFDAAGTVDHIKDSDIFVSFTSDQIVQAYSRDLGDDRKYVFELNEDGTVFRDGIRDVGR